MVHQEYQQILLAHRAIQPHEAQAGEIAIAAFRGLDEENRIHCLASLQKISAQRPQTYQSLAQGLQEIIDGRRKPTGRALQLLVSGILPFLPAEKRCEMLRLEVLHHIQRHKLAITRNYTRRANVEIAFNIYSEYLAGLYALDKLAYTWFHESARDEQERFDVVAALEYVYVVKLKASVSHFKKDLRTIVEKAHRVPKKMVYFIELLGIEVEIPTKNFDLDKLYTYDEIPLPAFASGLGELLKAYLFAELSHEDYLLAVREMQDAVLAHDLETALTHYQQSKTLTNRVDISFQLKGGAGTVKLEIKSWLTSLLVSHDEFEEVISPKNIQLVRVAVRQEKIEANWRHVAIYVVVMFAFFVHAESATAKTAWFFFLIFANIVWLSVSKDDEPSESELLALWLKERENTKQFYFDFMQEQRNRPLSEYDRFKTLTTDTEAELAKWQEVGGLFDKAFLHLRKLLHEDKTLAYWYPDDCMEAFEAHISRASAFTIEALPSWGELEELTLAQKDFLMRAVTHILAQKLRRSQYFCYQLTHQMYALALEGVVWVNFLDRTTVVCTDFYQMHKDLPRQHSEKLQDWAGKMLYFHLSDAPDLSEWQEAADWVRLNREILANAPIETELKALRDYAELVERGKKSRHQVLLPLILEGEEAILYL